MNRDHSPKEAERGHSLYVGLARPLTWIAGSLLVLCTISILTMPLTQYLWAWDGFMRGGQDFELGALMVLTLLCLALVLPKHCKQYIQGVFVRSGHGLRDRMYTSLRQIFAVADAFASRTKPVPTAGTYDVRLQI